MKKTIFRLLGIALFIVILFKIDFTKAISILSKIRLEYLLLAMLFIFLQIALKAYRWNYLKKRQKMKFSLTNSSLMYFSSLYLGIITPGRIGELSKIFYLKKEGHGIAKSSVSVVMDRLNDLIYLILVGIGGMMFFSGIFNKELKLILYSLTILLIIFVILIINRNVRGIILRRIFMILVPNKYHKKVSSFLKEFYSEVKKIKTKGFITTALITIASFILYYIMAFMLAISLNINISFFYLSICVTISAFITMIPISIVGIGTRDLTLIGLFSFLSINQETAVAFSLLILLMNVFVAIIGLISWFKKPLAT